MSSSFGVHLIARQVLQYLLCQWHHWVQARTYRRASVSQRHIQKERQMPGKNLLLSDGGSALHFFELNFADILSYFMIF